MARLNQYGAILLKLTAMSVIVAAVAVAVSASVIDLLAFFR